MSQYAADRIALILEQIQHLHAQARALSNEHGIPFDLELDGGRYNNTTHEYEPDWSSSNWNSSNC